MDFGGSIGPNSDGRITAGSIAGSGTYYIGAGNLLTVGGNNLSTEVSGVIADFNPCGCGPVGPGNLEKVGTGTLILSGTNTYTGGTLVDGVPCWWPARSRVPPSCLSITVRRSVARVRFR